MDEAQLSEVFGQIVCREQQVTQLSLLLDPTISTPSTIVLHGPAATAKSFTIRSVLQRLPTPHAIVESRECITGRHLLERSILSVRSALSRLSLLPSAHLLPSDNRVESLSALNVHLHSLLTHVPRFVLVFDGVDKQREAPPTLLPALARLGELIPSLTVVLVVTSPRPRYFHATGVPFIHFPSYTRDEALTVLGLWTRDIWLDDPADELVIREISEAGPEDGRRGNNGTVNNAIAKCLASYGKYPDPAAARAEDNKWLWERFASAVYDSLGKGSSGDVLALRRLCDRLWPAFVTPVRKGEYGVRDFARLMVRNRALFQSEAGLRDGLLVPETLTEADFDGWRNSGGNLGIGLAGSAPATAESGGTVRRKAGAKGAHELPYYGKFLLVAAYLASHNPARTDPVFFMKMHEKKRKKIGGAGYRGPGRPPKHRGITRKLLGPQPFPMERWLAIFYAIVPRGDEEDTGGVGDGMPVAGSADLLTQVATLAALRLIVKASLSSNIMDSSAKWRANVGQEYVMSLAKSVRFELADYLTAE